MSWPKGKPHPAEPYRRKRRRMTTDEWIAGFVAKVELAPTGCWTWTGVLAGGANRGREKYGYVQRHGRMQPAHRAYWEVINGPVPDGLDLDHLCRNRRCVNPEHLEPVTRLQNIMRGELGARWLRARRHEMGRA